MTFSLNKKKFNLSVATKKGQNTQKFYFLTRRDERHETECQILAKEPERPIGRPRGPGPYRGRPYRGGRYRRPYRYPGYRRNYGLYPWAYPALYPWYSYWYRRPYVIANDAFLPDLSENTFDSERANARDVDRRLSELRAQYRDSIAKNFEIVPNYVDGNFIWVKEVDE